MKFTDEMTPIFLTDFYKTLHHMIYVEGMEYLTSYWTPRKVIDVRKDELDPEIVTFGLQAFIKKYLIEAFNEHFFKRDIDQLAQEYQDFIRATFSVEVGRSLDFLYQLHSLGHLPISIRAVPEGTIVPAGCPMIEITNTVPGFGWLVNYLEVIFSCSMWMPSCAASIARQYRKIVDEAYHITTNADPRTACCDFSMRGASSLESCLYTGAGHMLSFFGSSTIPAYWFVQKYYGAKPEEGGVARCTPSTEHSVMSSYGRENELDAYIVTLKTVTEGPVSIVSDTYDYWELLTKGVDKLKPYILNRKGKTLFRGDSGDPVDIICGKEVPVFTGDPDLERCNTEYFIVSTTIGIFIWYKVNGDSYEPIPTSAVPPEYLGTVQILYERFGGHINSKGFIELDPHVGAIYGEGITLQRAKEIYRRLRDRGFAASCVGFGIGSLAYQLNTRDTYGFALKASHAVVYGKPRLIYKDPKTDNIKLKKSHKGLVKVFLKDGEVTHQDGFLTRDAEYYKGNIMQEVFREGELRVVTSLPEIRRRLWPED